MANEVTGRLIQKGDVQQVKDTFRKREFVLDITEEGSMYQNYAKLQLTQGKCDLLEPFNEGDSLKVSFNIRGNKWEKDGKVNYITSLDAWKIEPAGAPSRPSAAPSAQAYAAAGSQPAYAPQANAGYFTPPASNAADDLPF